jgi:hypothetical protein
VSFPAKWFAVMPQPLISVPPLGAPPMPRSTPI